ncbi:MAG: AraC family transcriptional regulator, partial [Methylococcaceae bacterium]|nr:AraC family transcriptional regulator [Methylococcaceae bacterium]
SGGVCGRWLMDHNSDTAIWFHLLGKGEGWAHSPTWEPPLKMDAGDLVLFLPHAEKHYLSYSPHEVPFDTTDARAATWEEGPVGFVCGLIELSMPNSAIWQALPAEIVIKKADAGEILSNLIQLIIKEAAGNRFGSFSVIERLCDGIFVLVMRHCIEQELINQGVFVAMQDRRLETVLGLIHQQPWQPWTMTSLCSHAGLSKTAMSEKFTHLLGSSPIEYLTTWRMQIASSWLKESGMTVERVAERCGYDSVSAFSKAFKRSFGMSPGCYRKGIT